MTHTFVIQIEPSMLRRSWNAWCFAGGRGWRLLIAFVIMSAGLIYLFRDGSPDTSSIVLLTAACLSVTMGCLFYFLGLRRAQAKSEALIDGRATYTFSDATIEASSALGSIALAWSALAEVRGYRDLVLLGFRGAMYSPLPFAQIPPDALAFLIGRARSAGAKIAGL
ncbi:MAG: hypothetical protein ABL962_09470 [Fimbriimonadaceae bacterium]